MRRKSSGQGNGNYNNNNNQQRKQRFQQGGGGGQNRPRKNYSAMREKYLSQARDALAQGDRVLAENYFQHADHCYRMMVEEGYNTRNNYTPPAHQADPQDHGAGRDDGRPDDTADNVAQLPAFLTASIDDERRNDTAAAPNWEE